MLPQVIGTIVAGAVLGVGAVENSNWLIGAGGVGMTMLQFVVMGMVQPLRDRMAKLETKVAVLAERLEERHPGHSDQLRHRTPRPLDDTPI